MHYLTALQVFTVLLLVHTTSGQTVTVSGPSRAAAATYVPLTCTVNGGTAPLIQWIDVTGGGYTPIYHGQTRFSTLSKYFNFIVTSLSEIESVMTIENAEVEDDGAYICSIPSDENASPKNLVVETASTLTLTLISTVTNGKDMNVATCDAVGGKPQNTLTWTLNGVTQTDGNGNTIVETNPPATAPLSNSKSVFTFPATLENYGQTLVCQVSGHQIPELNGQESTDLNIHTSPSDAGTTVTADYATQATSITVSCNAKNQPSPAMRNYYIFSNGTLLHDSMEGVDTVSVSDPIEGTNYTCLAGNYLGNTTLSEGVTYDPSRPTIPPTTEPITTEGRTTTAPASPSDAGTIVSAAYVTQGADITVSCTAENQPTPAMRNYYIFSNGTLIHESMEGGNQATVSDPEEGTKYTCMAGNYLGNTPLSAAITYDPTTSPSVEGTTVTAAYVTHEAGITVSCTAQNQPIPAMRHYYIFSNGTLIHESMEGGNEVTVSDPEEGTNYTCKAGNYLGNTTLSEALTYDPSREDAPKP